MNPYSRIPELQLLDSSSSPASSFRPHISLSLAVWETKKMSNCNAGVCDGVYGPSGMRWDRISLFLSLFHSGYSPPATKEREREREMAIGIYMVHLYTRLCMGKPVRLTINHRRVYAPFPSTVHAPPRFKILLSLVGYSVMIRCMQGRARTGFSYFLRV